MQYFGGKNRIRHQIANLINSYSPEIYIEPFLGGCNILPLINAPKRIGTDICKPLISMYLELQKGWDPPDTIDRECYELAKLCKDKDDPLIAFIGFGCSFGGKWFGGMGSSRNYAYSAKRSLKRKFSKINKEDVFYCCDYKEWGGVQNTFIYCDPPYPGTTKFGYCGDFDIGVFWEWVRQQSKQNTVLVSGYTCPIDFSTVLEIQAKTDVTHEYRIEKIFKC